MAVAAITRKIHQAEFHLSKLRALSQEQDDDFLAECHFASLLACVRTCVFYVETWLRDHLKNSGTTFTTKDWKTEWTTRLHAWEAKLAPKELEHWKALTRLRNQDIHEEPVVPDPGTYVPVFAANSSGGGFFEMSGGMGGFSGAVSGRRKLARRITDQKSGKSYDLTNVAELSIAVATRLLAEHQTI